MLSRSFGTRHRDCGTRFRVITKDMPQGWQSFNLCRGRVGGVMVRVRSLTQRIEAGR
jgi:hypothetical protein